jgi:GntR family transcriptional regulator
VASLATKFFNPFPKYLQVRNVLLRRLQNELAPGDRFPTEIALSEEFGVSRETIREALSDLEERGLIIRVRGRGTTVQRRPVVAPDQRVTGLVEDFTELKRDTWTRVLAKEVREAQPPISLELEVPAGEPIYVIRRLRFLDRQPLAIHEAYLPVEIGVPIGRLDLTRTTISRELQSWLRAKLREDYQAIDACVADPDSSKLLGISVGAPLLLVQRRYLSAEGEPLVLFKSWFRSDRYFVTIRFPAPRREKGTKVRDAPRRRAPRRQADEVASPDAGRR